MNKYYPYKSKEEVLQVIKRLNDKLAQATTDFDKFYLEMRIKSLKEIINEN